MIFTEQALLKLSERLSERMSEKRFRHTLGVERAAIKIAERCFPSAIFEIRAAALLHDITKEMSDKEQSDILKSLSDITESDLLCPSVFHSLTAPYVIKKDFSAFATDNILSAVRNHTTGAPDMSLFDEIIFISDYIEDGRSYASCISVRESLYLKLDKARDAEECIAALHDAVISALDFTITNIIKNGNYLNERTVLTRNAFLGRRPIPLK